MHFFCYSTPSTDKVETDLSHLAELAGVSRERYILSMCRQIREGRILEILKEDVQLKFLEWIFEHSLFDNKTEFCILLITSINKVKNSAMWLKCVVDISGDVPMVRLRGLWPGFVGEPPNGFSGLLFSLNLNDLEMGDRKWLIQK